MVRLLNALYRYLPGLTCVVTCIGIFQKLDHECDNETNKQKQEEKKSRKATVNYRRRRVSILSQNNMAAL